MQLDQASYLARVHAEAVARRQRLGFGRSPLLLAAPARKPRVNRSSDGRATSYIKLRCDASPFTFEEVVGRRKTKDLADFRRQLYVDVSEKFPSLSLPQIGAIFNRDHTTILSFLKKAGRVTQPKHKVTPEIAGRMK